MQYMKNIICFHTILLISLLSCSENNENEQLVKNLLGREIDYSESVFTIMGKDTVNFNLDGYEYKILTYVDSKGCTACQMKIEEWKEYMNMVDSLSSGKVGFIFYYAPKSFGTVRFILQEHNFEYPVIIDTINDFGRRNSIPGNYMLQTFLLDRENRIAAIGNPIINKKIKILYNHFFCNNATTNLLSKSTWSLRDD